ncbi:hypothetical protein FACS1894110_23040 [Spirochaetia bacterium]|nr:hypothetical protein FACS1894110_23040 [Spirochaetia bacterium]
MSDEGDRIVRAEAFARLKGCLHTWKIGDDTPEKIDLFAYGIDGNKVYMMDSGANTASEYELPDHETAIAFIEEQKKIYTAMWKQIETGFGKGD